MAFSKKLLKLRNGLGLSQTQLGEALGVSKQTIIGYETGKGYPKFEMIPKIAAFFNISTDTLMSEQDLFISEVQSTHGTQSARNAEEIINNAVMLLAGGTLGDADSDAAIRSLQDAYLHAKIENKRYTPKKYLK